MATAKRRSNRLNRDSLQAPSRSSTVLPVSGLNQPIRPQDTGNPSKADTTSQDGSPPRPSKRSHTTGRTISITFKAPYATKIDKPKAPVVDKAPVKLIIRPPQRPSSPPAPTIHFRGVFLRPGHPDYELAKSVTQSEMPYWFVDDPLYSLQDYAEQGAEQEDDSEYESHLEEDRVHEIQLEERENAARERQK